jgi:pyridoxamine 5'-phosphate oxidase
MGNPESLPPWRALLRGAREREGRAPQARWLQLASVAADGGPRVRTLVFRGWAGPAALDLLSDARSAKPAELAHQPALELCWLLPKARSQFRLRGHWQRLPPALEQRERQRHWQALTPSGRAVWGWPAPGEPLDPARRCRSGSWCCASPWSGWSCWNSAATPIAGAAGSRRRGGGRNRSIPER